jgi:hypothetical protein
MSNQSPNCDIDVLDVSKMELLMVCHLNTSADVESWLVRPRGPCLTWGMGAQRGVFGVVPSEAFEFLEGACCAAHVR